MSKKKTIINNRGGFVFYRSYFEAVKGLDFVSQAKYYNAVFNYIFNDTLDELNGFEKSLFILIKPALDSNKQQYINGKKGGRPLKSNDIIDLQNNPNITQQEPNDNPNITQTKPLRIKNKDLRIKSKELKNKYGEYKNVLLTIEDYNKLKEKFDSRTEAVIKELDEGIELKGYKYKNHYVAILKWQSKKNNSVEPKRKISMELS